MGNSMQPDTHQPNVSPLSAEDIDGIADGIEHFIMDGDPEVDALWQPYIDKLNALKVWLETPRPTASGRERLNTLLAHKDALVFQVSGSRTMPNGLEVIIVDKADTDRIGEIVQLQSQRIIELEAALAAVDPVPEEAEPARGDNSVLRDAERRQARTLERLNRYAQQAIASSEMTTRRIHDLASAVEQRETPPPDLWQAIYDAAASEGIILDDDTVSAIGADIAKHLTTDGRETRVPQPPAFDYVAALQEAKAHVRASTLWKRFIDGTPLENDIAVWMTNFAAKHRRQETPAAPPAPDKQVCPRCLALGFLDPVDHLYVDPMAAKLGQQCACFGTARIDAPPSSLSAPAQENTK